MRQTRRQQVPFLERIEKCRMPLSHHHQQQGAETRQRGFRFGKGCRKKVEEGDGDKHRSHALLKATPSMKEKGQLVVIKETATHVHSKLPVGSRSGQTNE
mmetsp:Transcript_29006/g.56790  ORF Transcript_29006/g.56790 Transcript_29006/m.56790 type:complete len:100 (+) Transcript_29006:1561-1860(+)